MPAQLLTSSCCWGCGKAAGCVAARTSTALTGGGLIDVVAAVGFSGKVLAALGQLLPKSPRASLAWNQCCDLKKSTKNLAILLKVSFINYKN
jgi:hypothetical protein